MVEGATIPEGEEEVTIDEVLHVSEMLEYSKLFPTNHNVTTLDRGGMLNQRVAQPR